jgi:hypothetical protein
MDFYYASRSKEEREAVCEALSEAFGLPAFTYDAHVGQVSRRRRRNPPTQADGGLRVATRR